MFTVAFNQQIPDLGSVISKVEVMIIKCRVYQFLFFLFCVGKCRSPKSWYYYVRWKVFINILQKSIANGLNRQDRYKTYYVYTG